MEGSFILSDKKIDLLLTRRSIRTYKSDNIPDETLKRILSAAKYAPSAMGLQNRFFTIVKNQEFLQEIINATKKSGSEFLPGHTPFYNAPAVIIVSAPKDFKYNREDTACAIMNIMLAAHAYGLGSCYICSVLPGLNDKYITEKLGLPDGYNPYGCVCIGYSNEKSPEPKPRRTDDIKCID